MKASLHDSTTSPHAAGIQRRGVILLLVLGMLALFSLLTATYVIFTSQSRLASSSISQRNTRALDPNRLLDQSTLAVLVGSQDNSSWLRGHSILEDRYGNDVIHSKVLDGSNTGVKAPAYVINGHFFRVHTDLNALDSPIDDVLVGRYLTFEEGPLRDVTFRIVRSYAYRTGMGALENNLDRMLVLDVGSHLDDVVTAGGISHPLSTWLTSNPNVLFFNSSVGYKFLINGQPRNGNGYGYAWAAASGTTPAGYNVNDITTIGGEQVPTALLPNYAALGSPFPSGASDEPYDVPDYRDMYLAHFPTDPELGPQTPSFVRPALINYLAALKGTAISSMTNVSDLQGVLDMLIRSTMRPLPIQNHPQLGSKYANFSGGGEGDSAFSKPINYASPNAADVEALAIALATGGTEGWDVDNTGDGIQDSVFVNAGLPLVTMPDGTLVQPMPAYRIEDLSGRVNINTAGSLATMAHLDSAYNVTNRRAAGLKGMFPRTNMTQPLPQGGGFGYGPAEIDPRALHPSTNLATANADWLEFLRRRYGSASSGKPGTGNPNQMQADEAIGALRKANIPRLHTYQSWLGMPQDVWGRGRVAVDLTGSPLLGSFASVIKPDPTNSATWFFHNEIDLDGNGTVDANEIINDPYEAMLYHQLRGDYEFALADFEAVARRWDWDRAQLPQRLFDQVTGMQTSYDPTASIFRSVTPISSSDEIPPSQLPNELTTVASATPGGVLEQPNHPVFAVLKGMGFTRPISDMQAQTFSQTNLNAIRGILPPEVRLGGKLDLNRWLGNGFDDDGDGVIDDPQEMFATVENIYASLAPALRPSGDFTPEAGPLASTPAGHDLNGSRQRMAKDLYCLMMALLYDPNSGNTTKLYRFPDFYAANADDNANLDYTARRVAQWAVNVVDFRDPDSIMTRFVYDTRPFVSGWDISASSTTKGVVFGMEAPELLLTEALAMHDRRCIDTPAGGSSTDADPMRPWDELDDDLDQQRIPQGSCFLELYRPSSPMPYGYVEDFSNANNPNNRNAIATAPPHASDAAAALTVQSPTRMYWIDGNDVKLNLAARTPNDGNPVFRIAISEVHEGANDSPLTRIALKETSDVTSFQTPQRNRDTAAPFAPVGTVGSFTRTDFTDPANDVAIDRIVWLTNYGPSAVAAANRPSDTTDRNVYWNRYNPTDNAGYEPYILGGQYAVIGPRDDTYVGAMASPTTIGAAAYNSPQRLLLRPDSFTMYDASNASKTPGNVRPVVGIRAAAEIPSAWSGAAITEIDFSISEPVPENYYPEPTVPTYAGGPVDAYATATDEPFDKTAPVGTGYTELINLRTDDLRTGTTMDFRTAFLQRLADPTQDYDAELNPYVTIDWITLDLTVFNGEQTEQIERREQSAGNGVNIERHIDGDDPNPYNDPRPEIDDPTNPPVVKTPGIPIHLGGRYKSGRAVRTATYGNLIYSYDTVEPVLVTKTAPATVNVRVEIHTDTDMNAGGNRANPSTTIGYLNQSFGQRQAGPPTDPWTGAPANNPFTWLPWFNRPFSSPYELMFVPASAPGRLGAEIYRPSSAPPLGSVYEDNLVGGHYGAFLNLQSFDDVADGTYEAPNVGRILDWVRTPQPYDALEKFIDPASVSIPSDWPPTTTVPADYIQQHAAELFRPPYNWVGPEDVKGKINLNTIVSKDVYRALMLPRSRTTAEFTGGLFWDVFIASRKLPTGSGSFLPGFTGAEQAYPTAYPGVFQPRASAHFAPLLDTTSGAANRMRRKEHEAGLTRRSASDDEVAVFERLPDGTIELANDPDRHPFFRYDEISRLPNLTSTNSNTFAMWVTVGLFVVDPATLNVGAEYGSDQGNNTRYRSFYIIDRSVPVGFEPGKASNARNTIIYSRSLN